jgi:hypothetical protein
MRSCKSKAEYNDSQAQANTDKWNTDAFVLQNMKVQNYYTIIFTNVNYIT